jgi:fucokinase
MKHDLDRNDVDGFAAGIERYFALKSEIDAGYTNAPIERLIVAVDKYLVGKVLPGAGGGGFVFMIARDEEAAQKVRVILSKSPPNAHARFFDFAIDPEGLKVAVL